MNDDTHTITRLLEAYQKGDDSVETELIRSVETMMRDLAIAALRREAAGHTLQPTALLNEAWIKLFRGGSAESGRITNRDHFRRLTARAIRNLLVDHARAKRAGKRIPAGEKINQGELEKSALESMLVDFRSRNRVDALELSEAIETLSAKGNLSDRQQEIIHLRFYLGHTVSEVAEILGVSLSTIEEDWRFARANLRMTLGEN